MTVDAFDRPVKAEVFHRLSLRRGMAQQDAHDGRRQQAQGWGTGV